MSSRNNETKNWKLRRIDGVTIAVLNEEIEGVVIAVVGEFVVSGRQPLEALSRNCRKVASELGVLRQYHRSSRHEAVYKRFLTHLVSHSVNSEATESRSDSRVTSTFFVLLLPHHSLCSVSFVSLRRRKHLEKRRRFGFFYSIEQARWSEDECRNRLLRHFSIGADFF